MAIRRYPQFSRTPNLVKSLPSEGSATVVQTVVPHRRRMMGGSTPNRVMALASYGTVAGPGRTTKNTDTMHLGMRHGMSWRVTP